VVNQVFDIRLVQWLKDIQHPNKETNQQWLLIVADTNTFSFMRLDSSHRTLQAAVTE